MKDSKKKNESKCNQKSYRIAIIRNHIGFSIAVVPRPSLVMKTCKVLNSNFLEVNEPFNVNIAPIEDLY